MSKATLQTELQDAFKAAMDAAATAAGAKDLSAASEIHTAAGKKFGEDAVAAIENYLKELSVSLTVNAHVDITGKSYTIPKEGGKITVGPWSGIKVKGTADGIVLSETAN
jgi:hypothetical protein